MKILLLTLLILLPKLGFPIGWEEIPKSDIEYWNIDISIEHNSFKKCYDFQIHLPNKMFFENLGYREFNSATYKLINKKTKGWQLSGDGTQNGLNTELYEDRIEVKSLCIGDNEIKNSFLIANYSGIKGTIPMVVIINLSEY